MNPLLQKLGITIPIIQAPMAGTSTPAMAAAVSNAGGLGSLGVGATDAAGARDMIVKVRAASNRAFNVNLFCHKPAVPDPAREAGWIEHLRPVFARFDAQPPPRLREIYKSFVDNDEMLEMLLAERPAVVSFHFGLPSADRIAASRDVGILLLASATNLTDGRTIEAAGMDAVVAQGYEAGGHRGVFDEDAPDEKLGTMALTRLLVRELNIAAGTVPCPGTDAVVIEAIIRRRVAEGAAHLIGAIDIGIIVRLIRNLRDRHRGRGRQGIHRRGRDDRPGLPLARSALRRDRAVRGMGSQG